ncbi:MAG: hypothetical protein ACK5V1_01930 [Planctomycetaceae bacterium]
MNDSSRPGDSNAQPSGSQQLGPQPTDPHQPLSADTTPEDSRSQDLRSNDPGPAGSRAGSGATGGTGVTGTTGPAPVGPALSAGVARCQAILAHAWMVRTFVKHSPEAEEFPELLELPRAVFDLSRALETRVEDPAGYFKMLDKKLAGLKRASQQFAQDAPLASVHTNFQQAVISIATCVTDLSELLARHYTPPPIPPSPRPQPRPTPPAPPADSPSM